MELVELQENREAFATRGVDLVATAIDPPADLTTMRKGAGASFPFLSDPEGQLMDLLDVRHAGGGPTGNDIPQSANFLIAPDGTVLWKHLADNYRERLKPEDVLAAIDGAL